MIFGAMESWITLTVQELLFHPASVTTTKKLFTEFATRGTLKLWKPVRSVIPLQIRVQELYISANIQVSVVTDTLADQEFVYAGAFRMNGCGVMESWIITTVPLQIFHATSVAETVTVFAILKSSVILLAEPSADITYGVSRLWALIVVKVLEVASSGR